MTWRSTEIRAAFRNLSTWRNSSGIALTAMMPACGLVKTLRPSPFPTMPLTASVSSAQKSLRELVDIRLLSVCCELLAPAPGPGTVLLPKLLTLLAPLLLPLVLPPLLATNPADTLRSLMPWRCELG